MYYASYYFTSTIILYQKIVGLINQAAADNYSISIGIINVFVSEIR